MSIAELDTGTIKARPGARLSDKQAQAVAPELFAIERRDGLATPEAVVTAAQDPTSALHPLFDWDDVSAAHKQRLQVARQIIRSVSYRVQSIGKDVNDFTPAFVHVREGGEEEDDGAVPDRSGYASITRVLGDEAMRQRMIAAAKRDLEGWVRKYETLTALEKAMTTARELLEDRKSVV